MDRRSEPRFENYTSVRLRPLKDSGQKLDCVVVDISGAGMRIVSPENLAEETIVGLEFTDQIVLANVCRSQPFGDKFALGAQRIHAVSKATPLRKKAEIENLRVTIEAFVEQRRTKTGEPEALSALDADELAHLDRQIEEYFEFRQDEPTPSKPKRREDAVKRILDRINRIDRSPQPKSEEPSLVQLLKVCSPAPNPEPVLAATPSPEPASQKTGGGKCGLPSWFRASLVKPGSF